MRKLKVTLFSKQALFGVKALLFLLLWLYLSNFSRLQNNFPPTDYRAEVFSDKAGYYSFLPAVFLYNFKADQFPNGIDLATGDGFYLNKKTNKVETKYTCGNALLATPFFLVTHWYQLATGEIHDGFSKPYFVALNYSSIFYLLLGLVILYHYLKTKTHWISALLTTILVFSATNLFYYGTIDTFMTHVYSFFLFASILWVKEKYLQTNNNYFFILLAVVSGMIVLIRPTNILFLGLVLLIKSSKNGLTVKDEIRSIFSWKNIIIGGIIFLFILSPQFIYNNYINGSPLQYSYKDEGFPYLLSPKILDVLFNPNNGLFLYSPLYLFLFIAVCYSTLRNKNFGWIGLFAFLLMLYVCSSWHAIFWGCGFGQRNFVDILPIFAISLSFLFNTIQERSKWLLAFIALPIGIYLTILNISLSRTYERCFQGASWEWEEYHKLIKRSDVFPFNTLFYSNYFMKEDLSEIKIKTYDGSFVTINKEGILTVSKTDTEDSKLYIVKTSTDLIGFKTTSNQYVSSDFNLKGLCIANRNEMNNWEKFKLIKESNGFVKIQNSQGVFIRVANKNDLKYMIADTIVSDSSVYFKLGKW